MRRARLGRLSGLVGLGVGHGGTYQRCAIPINCDELGKKYLVDNSDNDKENKPVRYRNKKDEPEYKGPPDND